MEKTYRSYSQRNGHEKLKPMQLEGFDAETRMAIWNVFAELFHEHSPGNMFPSQVMPLLDRSLFKDYLKAPLDGIGVLYGTGRGSSPIKVNLSDEEITAIQRIISEEKISLSHAVIKIALLDSDINKPIYQIFDILEIAIRALNKNLDIQVELIMEINEALRQNRTLYRLQESCGLFMKVANEAELEAINKASVTPHEQVNKQINNSINKYRAGNYNDCVAVASNALESILKIVADTPDGTTSDALKKLRNDAWYKDKIHGSIQKAIENLYGYASSTVRHGQTDDEKDPTEKEALFVLVTCSSVINYLVSINKDN